MKFGPVSLSDALGKVLAHNISDQSGRRRFRKGQEITGEVAAELEALGLHRVYVAEVTPGDVREDEACARVARILEGPGIRASQPHTGRVNLEAETLGVLEVDAEALGRLNQIEGFSIATRWTHSVAAAGERVATIKVIPYAVPWEAVARAEALAGETPILALRPIPPRSIAITLVGSPGVWGSLEAGLGEAIQERGARLGATVRSMVSVPMDEEALAMVLRAQKEAGAELLVIAGETAIMDLDDLIPRGVRLAGGRVEHLGLAMDPGHLLLLAYLGETPVIGAPGCVRSPNPDGFDALFPRLLAGIRLARADLQALGHGGLLSNPRGERGSSEKRARGGMQPAQEGPSE